MSRRGSFAALVLSVVLVAGSIAALITGVALGVWHPAGPPPATATPNPGSGPGSGSATVEYGEFLDDVRAGRVSDVFKDGDILQVNATDRPYTVKLPPGDPDVFDDMQAAADAGGVPIPGFTTATGPDETPEALTYAVLLELVKAGRVYDVFQEGDRLMVSAVDGSKDVKVPAGVHVLDDLEAAAEAGGVLPPTYTKIGGKPG